MKLLPHIFITRRVALANDTTRRAGLVGLSNEAVIGDDGWVKISPYGDHKKIREIEVNGVVIEEKFIQRLTPENARQMAETHNSLFGKIRRLRRGAPIYRGHADRYDVAKVEGVKLPARGPALSNEKMGIFAELQARADGLYALPVFAEEGRVAIENDGLKYFSPLWWTDCIGFEGEWEIAIPVEFISAALTAHPNISGSTALANERGNNADSDPKTQETMNKKLLEKILGICRRNGIALANEDEATIDAGLDQLDTKLTQRTALENEKTTTLTPRITALENEVRTEKDAHGTTRVALENARTAHATSLVDLAIAEGRITPSERPAKLALFGAKGETFDAGKKALENEAVKYPTTSRTGAARKETSTIAKPTALEASKRLTALANEKFDKGGFTSPEDAYAAAREEHPELVAKIEEAKAKE